MVDNGSGISESDYENIGSFAFVHLVPFFQLFNIYLIALKHHTSKLETFSDLSSVRTFGFRGEALSSLCAMSEQVTVTTATSATSPLGISLDMDSHGRVKKRSAVARQVCSIFPLLRILASFSDRHDSHFDQPLHFTPCTKERIRKERQA